MTTTKHRYSNKESITKIHLLIKIESKFHPRVTRKTYLKVLYRRILLKKGLMQNRIINHLGKHCFRRQCK